MLFYHTMKKYFAILILIFLLSSCFRPYIFTEKEIRQHYDTLGFKPAYKTLKVADTTLFFASFGKDTSQPVLFIHGAPGRFQRAAPAPHRPGRPGGGRAHRRPHPAGI